MQHWPLIQIWVVRVFRALAIFFIGRYIAQKIKGTFDQQGISIPFPQRDLHLFQADKVEAAG